MPDSFLIVEHQKLRVRNVRDIIVTEIVTADGTHSRAIRIIGLPLDEGNPVETLELVVESDNAKTDIELTTPQLDY